MVERLFAALIQTVAMLVMCAACILHAQPARAAAAATLRFNDGVTAEISLPGGWRLGDDGRCLVSGDGIETCARTGRAGGMDACEWIEAAGRFMDAPNDRQLVIRKQELEMPGGTTGCIGKITSPRQSSIYHRVAFVQDENVYSLSTPPLPLDTDSQREQFQASLKEIAKSYRFSGEDEVAAIRPVEPVEPARPEQPVLEPVAEQAPGRPETGAAARPDFNRLKEEYSGYTPVKRAEKLLEADRARLAGHLENAEAMYREIKTDNPYDALVGLGDVEMARNRLDDAENFYGQARELDPDRAAAYNGLGAVSFMRGNMESAGEKYGVALEKGGGDPDTHANLGWLALGMGELVEAERHFMTALAMKPGPDAAASATNGLTAISFHYGEPEKALAWNVSLLQWLPSYPEARANLVRVFLMTGRPEDAAAEAKRLENLAPGAPGTKILAGRAYFHAGRYPDAAGRLCSLLEHGTEAAEGKDYIYCAESLDRTGEPARAAEILELSIERGTATADQYLVLARILEESGRGPEAAEKLHRAVEDFPGDARLADKLKEIGASE